VLFIYHDETYILISPKETLVGKQRIPIEQGLSVPLNIEE